MASVDIRKYTKNAICNLDKHYDDELRKKLNHSNPDINKEKTPENYWIGCENYRDALRKLDERVKEVDAAQPPIRKKADRITALSIYVPCPKEIELRGESKSFFEKAYHALSELIGAKNLVGAAVHRDEKHPYYDSRKKEMVESLEHMNIFAVPYTAEKGINAKARCTKKFFEAASEVVHQMCKQEFQVDFKTGEHARKKSVEQLKAESYLELMQTVERLSGDVAKLQQQLNFTESQLQEQLSTGKRVLSSINAEISTKSADMEKIRSELENAKIQAQEVEKRLRNVAASIESGMIEDLELKNILYCLEKHPGKEKIIETFRQLHDLGEKMLAADLKLQAEVLQQVFNKLKEETPVVGEHREKI